MQIIKGTSFSNVQIKAFKRIEIPDTVLQCYLKEDDAAAFKDANVGIFSVTVVGYK